MDFSDILIMFLMQNQAGIIILHRISRTCALSIKNYKKHVQKETCKLISWIILINILNLKLRKLIILMIKIQKEQTKIQPIK